ERLVLLEYEPLYENQRDVADLRCRQRESAGGQLPELVPPVVVGDGAAQNTLLARERDLRASQRRSGVGADHAAADATAAGCRLLRGGRERHREDPRAAQERASHSNATPAF